MPDAQLARDKTDGDFLAKTAIAYQESMTCHEFVHPTGVSL